MVNSKILNNQGFWPTNKNWFHRVVQSSKVGLCGCLCICVLDYCKMAFKVVFIFSVGLVWFICSYQTCFLYIPIEVQSYVLQVKHQHKKGLLLSSQYECTKIQTILVFQLISLIILIIFNNSNIAESLSFVSSTGSILSLSSYSVL